MKRKKSGWRFLLFALLGLLSLGIASCVKPPKELSAPQNLQVEKRVLTWDEVKNATGYVVFVNGTEYETTECNLDIHFLSEGGEYSLEVMTLGDGKSYTHSQWSEVTVTLEEAVAHGYDESGLEYTLLEDKSGYEVAKGNVNMKGVISIPDYFGDYPVTRIAKDAFVTKWTFNVPDPFSGGGMNGVTTGIKLPAYLQTIGKLSMAGLFYLEEIVIPNGVTTIEMNAFYGNLNLKRVVFPESLKEIGDSCFSDTAVEELVFPDGLEKIDASAFYNRTVEHTSIKHVSSALSSVEIPDSVTYIGSMAFCGRENLKDVKMSKNIEWIGRYMLQDTAWYEEQEEGMMYLGEDILYGYKGEMSETELYIPSTVKHIVGGAFRSQYNLEKVVLSEGVKLSGDRIFMSCDSLAEVQLPSDLTEIPHAAFYCTALKNIELPDGVTKIGRSAFAETKLERVVLPSGLKELGERAFSGCEQLKEVVLPESLESMGRGVFNKCKALTSVTIPSKVRYIGTEAFLNCTALEEIVFETPSDWLATKETDSDVDILAEDLSSPTTAATYLTDKYIYYTWQRAG